MSGDSSKGNSSSKGFKAGDRLPFEPKKPPKKSGKGKKAKAQSQSSESAAETADPAPKKPVPRKLNPITTFKNKDKADSSKKGGNKGSQGGDRNKPRGKVYTREEMAIPEVVSNRMLKRMLIFSGMPTFIGFASFIAGYFINVGTDIELPNVVVLLTSLGGLGLGVLGLSYGLVSTSWDEREEGSALGVDEAKVNVGRLIQAWKESRANR